MHVFDNRETWMGISWIIYSLWPSESGWCRDQLSKKTSLPTNFQWPSFDVRKTTTTTTHGLEEMNVSHLRNGWDDSLPKRDWRKRCSWGGGKESPMSMTWWRTRRGSWTGALIVSISSIVRHASITTNWRRSCGSVLGDKPTFCLELTVRVYCSTLVNYV